MTVFFEVLLFIVFYCIVLNLLSLLFFQVLREKNEVRKNEGSEDNAVSMQRKRGSTKKKEEEANNEEDKDT